MSRTEILESLKRLAPAERLAVIESALQQLREDLQDADLPLAVVADKSKQLASVAELLLSDYAADEELTAFTVLDSEDFHA